MMRSHAPTYLLTWNVSMYLPVSYSFLNSEYIQVFMRPPRHVSGCAVRGITRSRYMVN